jgi:hypothetical protein
MLKGIFAGIAVVIGLIMVLAQMNRDVRSLASFLGISGADVHSVAERVGISDTSADCEGVKPWVAATKARNDRFADEFEVVGAKFEDGSITQEDFHAAIQIMDAIAAVQARSNPPPVAAAHNALVVDAIERYSALFVTASNDEYADVTTANAVMDRATEAGDALAEQCGLY